MVSSFQRGSGQRRTTLCFAITCQQTVISFIVFHISLFTHIFSFSVHQSENTATTEDAAELPNSEQDSPGVSERLNSAHLIGAWFYLLITFICSLLLIFKPKCLINHNSCLCCFNLNVFKVRNLFSFLNI